MNTSDQFKAAVDYANKRRTMILIAQSILPESIPVSGVNAYNYSVDIHTGDISEREYHKCCEDLTDYVIGHYDLSEYHDGTKRVMICHKLSMDGWNLEVYFKVKTRAYVKLLNMVSDGKCKIKRETVVNNSTYTRTVLSCNS